MSPAPQDRARIVFDCRIVNDPAMIPSTNPAHVYALKPRIACKGRCFRCNETNASEEQRAWATLTTANQNTQCLTKHLSQSHPLVPLRTTTFFRPQESAAFLNPC